MAAARAPASAVTAPPPGVGFLAAAASRNCSIVTEGSHVMGTVARASSPCFQAGTDTGWKPVPQSLAAGVVLDAAGRQVHRGERFVLAPPGLRFHLLRLGRADGHHALREPLPRRRLDVLQPHAADLI